MPKHKVFDESDSDAAEYGEDNFQDDDDNKEEIDPADDADTDSEAEPETVTFVDSKKTVLDRVRSAIRQIERNKQETKDRRRKCDLVYKEQKKLKLAKLTKLPDDVLESVVSSVNSSQAGSQSRQQSLPRSYEKGVQQSTDELASVKESREVSEKPGLAGESEDFIPLSSANAGTIQAVSVNKQSAKAPSAAQKALNFRNQKMFNKHIRRETASSYLAKTQKRKALRQS